MEIAIIVVGLLAAALLGVSLWLLRERSQLISSRASAAAERDGALASRAAAEAELAARAAEIRTIAERLQAAQIEAAQLKERSAAHEQKQREWAEHLAQVKHEFQAQFKSLAGDALKSSNEQFLALAKQTFSAEQDRAKAELEKRQLAVDQLVKPIGESLKKTDEKLAAIEKERTATYAELREQVRAMADANVSLRTETGRLVQSLRRPQVRGAYGEMQLQRVAELAGMRSYCDFSTQVSVRDGATGDLLRPDMIVSLPNGRVVAVDAKCNIEPYLDAIQADDAEKESECLDRFARSVAEQAAKLARKEYWSQFESSPEFVVMFIPGEQFVDAALARRPDLMDFAAQKGVIIASPSTLIGLLRAVHVGWREKQLSDSAQELFALGKELHERAAVALEHAAALGAAINTAIRRYNDFAASIDTRLMPTLRRFEEGGAKSTKEIAELKPIDASPRTMQSLPAAQ